MKDLSLLIKMPLRSKKHRQYWLARNATIASIYKIQTHLYQMWIVNLVTSTISMESRFRLKTIQWWSWTSKRRKKWSGSSKTKPWRTTPSPNLKRHCLIEPQLIKISETRAISCLSTLRSTVPISKRVTKSHPRSLRSSNTCLSSSRAVQTPLLLNNLQASLDLHKSL